ncbi:Sas10/Utp3/C1D family-domain-containing protein [Tricladium varicosporioides]|nr:Sas10/Utp3/C1D family-domain-containing protein [Hymenoscyphus varicosporioides]
MDSTKIISLLEQLDDEIDDLEDSLVPLLKTSLAESASKFPLLDKAKLYVLVTYAIESILFSYLRLNGVKAREHPVFLELTRVKQYFDKIKATENPPVRTSMLDKTVAARFLQPDLVRADKSALQAAEQLAKQRAKAHIKFEELNKSIEKRENAAKRKAETAGLTPSSDSSSSDSDSDPDSVVQELSEEVPAPVKGGQKKRKVEKKLETTPATGPATRSKKGPSKKKLGRTPKKNRKKTM